MMVYVIQNNIPLGSQRGVLREGCKARERR